MLAAKVALFPSCHETTPRLHVSIGAVLEAIRNPSKPVADACAALRAESDKTARSVIKQTLPAVCFGADLRTRAASVSTEARLIARSGVICLDLDAVPNLSASKDLLASDPHVLAVWLSPSGDGLKALVPIAGLWEAHWRALASHVWSKYQLTVDPARKDVYGLCYASHDTDIRIADPAAVEVFTAMEEDPRPGFSANPARTYAKDGEVLEDFRDTKKAQDPLSRISPDLPYAEWVEIGHALHCQFNGGMDGLSLWDGWSSGGSTYPGQAELEKKWNSFRSAGITFRTVLRRAITAGWTMPRKIEATARQEIPSAKPSGRDHLAELIAKEETGAHALVHWPWPILSRESRSLLPGSVAIVCGAPGAAKSWFGMSCLRYWRHEGIAADVLMLEEDHAWHLNRLLAQAEGRPDFLDESQTHRDASAKWAAHARHKELLEDVTSHLWCERNITMSACAKWVEERCAAGARVLVIDPITLADNGAEKSWEADKRFMTRCQDAIVKSGTSLVLVTHPRKAPGTAPNAAPAMDDIAGGVVYSRASSSMLWIASATNETETVTTITGDSRCVTVHKIIRVLKSRNSIGVGKSIAYTFSSLAFQECGIVEKQQSKADRLQEIANKRKPNDRWGKDPSDDEDAFRH